MLAVRMEIKLLVPLYKIPLLTNHQHFIKKKKKKIKKNKKNLLLVVLAVHQQHSTVQMTISPHAQHPRHTETPEITIKLEMTDILVDYVRIQAVLSSSGYSQQLLPLLLQPRLQTVFPKIEFILVCLYSITYLNIYNIGYSIIRLLFIILLFLFIYYNRPII
jgi:hypothetical protein